MSSSYDNQVQSLLIGSIVSYHHKMDDKNITRIIPTTDFISYATTVLLNLYHPSKQVSKHVFNHTGLKRSVWNSVFMLLSRV